MASGAHACAGSARSMSVSKSVSTKPAPVSGAAPPPVTDQASARGDASTGDAVATQQRPEVVPTQQPHSQQKSQHVQQLQPVAAAPHPPHAQAPDMPMGANGMVPPNGMLSYGLHVRTSRHVQKHANLFGFAIVYAVKYGTVMEHDFN